MDQPPRLTVSFTGTGEVLWAMWAPWFWVVVGEVGRRESRKTEEKAGGFVKFSNAMDDAYIDSVFDARIRILFIEYGNFEGKWWVRGLRYREVKRGDRRANSEKVGRYKLNGIVPIKGKVDLKLFLAIIDL